MIKQPTTLHISVIVWMFVLLMLAFMLMPYGTKIIPGGPFVSIRGDVLTVLLAASAIVMGLRSYRRAQFGRRLVILAFCGLAVLFISTVVFNVVTFATDRYARGALVEW